MMTNWPPAATELDAYEGIRRGDERAFRAIAGQLQPVLRGVAGIYLNPPVADDFVVRGWEQALGGLDMFRWNTPLAVWLAKSIVAAGRAVDRHRKTVAPAPPRVPTTTRDGPSDWSDLPWSARWEGVAWPVLHDALAALPRGQREIVHGRDVERWPTRRVCDVFGVPEVVYGHLLLDARIRLCNAIGRCVGETGPGPHAPDEARITAITRMLGLLHQDAKEPLDARVLTVFRRWRAARRTGWRRVVSLPMRAASR